MIDFGYNINQDSQLNFDLLDRRLCEFIKSKEPSFNLCVFCGACTATCTAGKFTEFNLRTLFIRIKRGDIDGIGEEINKCMFCGKCLLICPRGINTRKVIFFIKKYLE